MLPAIKKVSIFGCGWLGLPLAIELLRAGYEVHGSTTSPEKISVLEEAGISPYLLVVGDCLEGETIDFFKTDLLIINIPPLRRRAGVEDLYPAEIRRVVERARQDGAARLIFISSTSVYDDQNRAVTEADSVGAEKGSGLALVRCEAFLQAIPDWPVTILRLGGLVGGDRKSGRFLAGKKQLKNGEAPVNMVHREDCIAIIKAIIDQEIFGETFNICADRHPSRREFYRYQAEKEGLEPPTFAEAGPVSYKIVKNDKVKRILGYSFKYPDPMAF